MVCLICESHDIKYYHRKNNHKLYKCKDCGLVFVWPVPDNLSSIYKKDYFKSSTENKKFGYVDYEKDKKAMQEVFIEYLEEIEKLSSVGKIFDIGAATGFFLDLAMRRGWQTFGIEISDYAAQKAILKDHNVLVGELKNFCINEKFDVLTMWDVMEHLSEVQHCMKKIKTILKDDGLLVINTIDISSLWARINGCRWHQFVPPEHLLYFSRKSLVSLLEENGMKIIVIKKIGKKFSLAYIFNILYFWQGFKIWSRLSDFSYKNKFLNKLSIPINLRDNIFIVASKTKDV